MTDDAALAPTLGERAVAWVERRIWLPCVLTVLGLGGALHWSLELLSAGRVQLAAGFVLVGLLAAVRRRKTLALVSAAGIAVNLWMVVPLFLAPNAPPTSGTPLRLVLINVYTPNERRDEVLAYIRSSDADVVGLLEVNGTWVEALDGLAPEYRQLAARPRADNFGVTLLTRLDGVEARVLAHGALSQAPAIEALIPWGGREIGLLVAHPIAPFGARFARDREPQLAAVAAWACARDGPTVVLADLNATPWSSSFASLLEATGLLDSTRGWGFQPTWPAPLLPLAVPLDHCLHDASLTVVSRGTGPSLGSDHYPLEIELLSH